MLEDLFKDLEKIINEPIPQKTPVPVDPVSYVTRVGGVNIPRNLFEGNKTASARVEKYSIDKEHRELIVDGHKYIINDFFNIENAVSGDFRTLDYIFTYNHLNINDFEVDKG